MKHCIINPKCKYFCVRLGGEWVEKCPNFPDGYPWDADRKEDDKWAEV